MTTELTRLEQEAAALGLTGESTGAAPAPPKARVNRADKILLAGTCGTLAAVSAIANVWLVIPVLIGTGLAACVWVHALNTPRSKSLTAVRGRRGVTCSDDYDRALRQFQETERDLATNPINHNLLGNSWRGML